MNINLLNDLYSKYKDLINFMAIYIEEAHSNDEWPIRTEQKLQIDQHQSIDDRINASKILIDQYDFNKIPLYIDSMENTFSSRYCAWPLRMILINNNNEIEWFTKPIDGYKGILQKELIDDLKNQLKNRLLLFGYIRFCDIKDLNEDNILLLMIKIIIKYL